MSITQMKNGVWKADFWVGGEKGERYRKRFKTKAEAERYQKYVEAQYTNTGKPWQEKPKDRRYLSQLVEPWYLLHGQYLKDGERRKAKLLSMADELLDPIAADLAPIIYTRFRAERAKQGIRPKTLNNELGYLSSLYNSLRKAGEIDYPNPLADIDLVKVPENELAYLTTEQIEELMQSIGECDNPHVELITLVCLCTGARWGEAEGLTSQRVHNGRVTFTETKNGKNRTVPVPDWLFNRLKDHEKVIKGSALFTGSISSFRRALKRTEIELPRGQAAHVLRHSFASHFMMNGGNILTLQRILGHSDIRITMRYSHLAPDHFSDAVKLNPIDGSGVTGIKKAA